MLGLGSHVLADQASPGTLRVLSRVFAPVALFGTLLGCGRPCPVEPVAPYAWSPAAARLDAPPPKPPNAVRFIVGGDSRQAFPREGEDGVPRTLSACDEGSPLGRALSMAQPSGASAFIFLGDMEVTPMSEAFFPASLRQCLDHSVAFCPVFGNHEALEHGETPLLHPDVARDSFARRDLPRCGTTLPDDARAAGRVFYALDLPGNVHFVSLDDVSEPGLGKTQLAWLNADLGKAHAANKVILVGMHKALAENHVTVHSMDEDHAEADSAAALASFEANGVALVLASHEHGFWELRHTSGQGAGVHGFITGGLGAPLRTCAGPTHAFFHYLVLDVVGAHVDVHVIEVPRRDVTSPGR